MSDTPPGAWEAQIARSVAHGLRREARAGLASGRWTAADVDERLTGAERRLTAAQRDVLWMSVIADVELAEMTERLRA